MMTAGFSTAFGSAGFERRNGARSAADSFLPVVMSGAASSSQNMRMPASSIAFESASSLPSSMNLREETTVLMQAVRQLVTMARGPSEKFSIAGILSIFCSAYIEITPPSEVGSSTPTFFPSRFCARSASSMSSTRVMKPL